MIHMISPPVYIRSRGEIYTVYGWQELGGHFVPIVANPDGPGIGLWTTYFGEDPWKAY